MNRKQNYTSPPCWQKAETIIKRIVIRLNGAGFIPDNQVKALFNKLPGLRKA